MVWVDTKKELLEQVDNLIKKEINISVLNKMDVNVSSIVKEILKD